MCGSTPIGKWLGWPLPFWAPLPFAAFCGTFRRSGRYRPRRIRLYRAPSDGREQTGPANQASRARPPNSPAAFAFAEMLLDFYGIRQVASGRLLLRIEDYDCESNHRDLRRMADFLFSRKIPFGVGVRGACDLNAQAEFADTTVRFE